MSIQIFTNDKNTKLDFNYGYLLAEDGLYFVKQNEILSAVVPVSDLAMPDNMVKELRLEPLKPFIQLNPSIRITFNEFFQAFMFCKHVYEKFHTEAFLYILHDLDTSSTYFWCPKQSCEGASVTTEEMPEQTGNKRVIGTLHSHPCSAFHSPGDEEDETGTDGLHIVLGDLHKEMPSIVATLVVKGYRQKIDPNDVIELNFDFDRRWLKKLNK